MAIKDLSLKLAAISLLADQAKRLKDELRAELKTEMDSLGADRVKAELGDQVVAYITTTKPKFKWVIKSDRKFVEWVKTNVPSEIVESVRESSIDAILDLIELKRKGELKKIMVSGCLAQRYGKELTKHLKDIDAFMGRISLNHTKERLRLTSPYYAYVKISEGCNNNCSYCIIPKIKGKYSSRTQGSILDEIDVLDKANTAELNIVGQDITLYGIDLYKTQRLHLLLREVLKHGKNIHWIRLLYLYPGHLEDELLDLIADEPKICKYIDLPIQHINDRILKLMNRKNTKMQILRLIEKVRKKIPSVAIRTSLIVGFPSETEADFQDSLDLIKKVKFDKAYIFKYSVRPNTKAAEFADSIEKKEKERRHRLILNLQKSISIAKKNAKKKN